MATSYIGNSAIRAYIESTVTETQTALSFFPAFANTSDYGAPKTITFRVYDDGTLIGTKSYGASTTKSWTVVDGYVRINSPSLTVSKTYTATHDSENKQFTFEITATFNSGKSINITGWTYHYILNPKASYEVVYNANGGSGAPYTQTKWYGETLRLSDSIPSHTNREFKRWNTARNDNGVPYNTGANYTANFGTTLYAIWNSKIIYDGNGGSGAPSEQLKTYGTSITLSSVTPTRTGYNFQEWNTAADGSGTSYSPGSTYTTEAPLILYAIWEHVGQAPTISSITAVRCTSSGTESDVGTYCKVTAEWSVDTASDAGMASNQGTVTGTIKASNSSTTRTITFSSGTSGTSGTAQALIANCDVDTQYTVTVKVTNTVMGNGNTSLLSTSRADILTRAFFTMDFKAGGNGVGVGCAAPSSGIEFGMGVQFDDDVGILGNLTAANFKLTKKTDADVISAPSSGPFSPVLGSCTGYRFGPFTFVKIAARAQSTALTAGTLYPIGTLTEEFSPKENCGFSGSYGHGWITGSSMQFRPTVEVGANVIQTFGVLFLAKGAN